MKILLVDDSKIFRTELLKLLININNRITVLEAESVSEAVELLKSDIFDLAILDFQLTDGNSIKILEQINVQNYNLYKIVLTNYFNETIKELCLKNGADHFKDKNGDFNDLISLLEFYLNNYSAN